MLETFAASAHFKTLIEQHQDMPAVQKYHSFLEVAAKDNSRDPFAGALLQSDIPHPSTSGPPGEPLSHRARTALALCHAEHSPNQPLPSYISYSKHTLGKVSFATHVSSIHNCDIAFISNNVQRPGIIRFIVAAEQSVQNVLFIVERYAPLPSNSVWSPFASHADFGANLWSEEMEDIWEVVPARNLKCHTTVSQWAKGILLIKALNRVS